MGVIDRRYSWSAKAKASALFIASGLSAGWLLITIARNVPNPRSASFSMVGLFAAGLMAFLRPRLAFVVAATSGVVSLYWFSRIDFPAFNSWILFNDASDVQLAISRIMFVAMTVAATGYCCIGLLPRRLTFHNSSVRERVWPAIIVSSLVVAIWYARSVSPYRIPLIVDAVDPELALLHIQKEGLTP
jgi:hypothetical protein